MERNSGVFYLIEEFKNIKEDMGLIAANITLSDQSFHSTKPLDYRRTGARSILLEIALRHFFCDVPSIHHDYICFTLGKFIYFRRDLQWIANLFS